MSPAYSYSLRRSDVLEEAAADEKPTLREAAQGTAWIMGLWALGYCLPNALNTLRHCTWAYAAPWEASLPYFGWMVFPYLSMNVLYGFAPLVCRTRAELRTLVRRMAVAIGVAATCFLLYPTRLPESKPDPVTGFDRLCYRLLNIDFPNNCFPSLHVAFALILASVYMRPLRGWRRWAVGGWFALIALSTVLARQHFVLDATAGLLLGWVACRWIRLSSVPVTAATEAADEEPVLLSFEAYQAARVELAVSSAERDDRYRRAA